jgi:hypothetical protein
MSTAKIVAISSDTPPRSRFASSDPDLDRLHENVVWSQRANFVSIPTDCPQRDERLGWTGDAQAFAATASTLFDAEAFWASWLRDLELDQDDALGVPSVVPDAVLAGEPRFGRAGWADAATIVPWSVYESYGDAEVLRRQLDSVRRWVASLVARRGPDGLIARDAVWRLARPGRAGRPTVSRGRLGVPRERLLRPARGSRAERLLGKATSRRGTPSSPTRSPRSLGALVRPRGHNADRVRGRAPAGAPGASGARRRHPRPTRP